MKQTKTLTDAHPRTHTRTQEISIMKTEELMLGDWLHSNLHNVDTQIIDIEHNAVWLKDKSCFERHFMSEVEPIKLTDELLRKNSPNYNSGYTFFWWTNNDGTFHVEWKQDNKGNEVILKSIQFVHELQHMLRMVHYEKKIEL